MWKWDFSWEVDPVHLWELQEVCGRLLSLRLAGHVRKNSRRWSGESQDTWKPKSLTTSHLDDDSGWLAEDVLPLPLELHMCLAQELKGLSPLPHHKELTTVIPSASPLVLSDPGWTPLMAYPKPVLPRRGDSGKCSSCLATMTVQTPWYSCLICILLWLNTAEDVFISIWHFF